MHTIFILSSDAVAADDADVSAAADSAVAYNEMFSLAKQIAASQTSFTPFVIAGIFYFVANYLVAFGMERIEKAFDYYH